MNPNMIDVSKAKTYVAALGTTVTAIMGVLSALSLALGDDAISIEEVSSLAGLAVSTVATVYGVWKAPYIKTNPNRPTVRGTM